MGSGQSFQLKPEMEANQGEEGQEGYGARNEGERDMRIQGGFLEEEEKKEEEEAVRESAHIQSGISQGQQGPT